MGKGLVGLKVMFFFCIVRVTTNNNHLLQVDQASIRVTWMQCQHGCRTQTNGDRDDEQDDVVVMG